MSAWEYAQLKYQRDHPGALQQNSTITTKVALPGGREVVRYRAVRNKTHNWTHTYYDMQGTETTKFDWLQLLNELGLDGWELVSETSRFAALVPHGDAVHFEGVLIDRVSTLKRQISSQ